MRQLVLLVIALLSLASAAAHGQANPPATPRARILGVYDLQTGEPIEGADVTDITTRTSARTTKTGTVSLAFLGDEGSLVQITKVGYQPQSLLVRTTPSDTTPVTVLLAPAATKLPTVVTRDSASAISPGLRGFEERRRSSNGGQFITAAELRKADNRRLSDVLRRLNGARVICRRDRPVCSLNNTRQNTRYAILGGACHPDIYVDGSVAVDGTDAVPESHNIDAFNVNTLAGVEYYAGAASVPGQFNRTGSSCGVLLLWTRER
jgi:hypothetical protein